MKVYRIDYDNQPYIVEAPDLGAAVQAWKKHVAVAWGSDWDGTEEPESISLIHDEAVIR